MNKIKKERLLKAAEVQAANPEQFPLCMGCFVSENGENVAQDNIEHPCGTAACFLGNCPWTGVPGTELIPDDMRGGWVNYGLYSHRVFGTDTKEWRWLFGASWPDSHEQNLLRVKVFLKHGVPMRWNVISGEYPYNWGELVESL